MSGWWGGRGGQGEAADVTHHPPRSACLPAYIGGASPVRDWGMEYRDRFKLSGACHSRKVVHLHDWRIWLHIELWLPARFDLSRQCGNDAR